MNLGMTRRALVTGALGVALALGGVFAPAASAGERAGGAGQVSLTLEPQADTASQSDGVDTYQITVTNRGGGEVKNIQLSVPIEPGYRLAGAEFTQSDAWVTENGSSAAKITIEQLRGVDDAVVGTLSFVGPTDARGNAIAGRVAASWRDSASRAYSIASNLPGQGVMALSASPVSLAGGAGGYSFSGAGFASNEPVTFWYTSAAGASTPLALDGSLLVHVPADDDDDEDEESLAGYLVASEQGALSVSLATAGLPAGGYTLAARGNWSGALAAAAFTVR